MDKIREKVRYSCAAAWWEVCTRQFWSRLMSFQLHSLIELLAGFSSSHPWPPSVAFPSLPQSPPQSQDVTDTSRYGKKTRFKQTVILIRIMGYLPRMKTHESKTDSNYFVTPGGQVPRLILLNRRMSINAGSIQNSQNSPVHICFRAISSAPAHAND